MRVLVTRPLEDARETEAYLKLRGHEAVVAPLLTVNFHTGPKIDLTGIQAILATSANGVRALSRRTERRDLPLFAVGPQTAQEARDAGFGDVKSADGDSAALARAVPNWASAANGPLLHASGADGEGKLAKTLAGAGFKVRTEFLYDVGPVSALPAMVRKDLEEKKIDAVLLFSPRSARIFAECVLGAGLGAAVGELTAVCISSAAAAALDPLKLRDIRIAERPNQTALLDRLG
jgi:uroporphyrinogen-III synthase